MEMTEAHRGKHVGIKGSAYEPQMMERQMEMESLVFLDISRVGALSCFHGNRQAN